MNTCTRGFTLIELLVVIAIIGLLASIIGANLSSAQAKSRDARRLEDMDAVKKALVLYSSDHNGYPPSVATTTFELGRVGEEHARAPDQIERGVGHRDVFFQERAVAAPLRQALAEHQPSSEEELAAIPGLGPAKLAAHGESLLVLLDRHR